MKTHKNCQSCGMPFNKDSTGGGTEANGTLSQKYCSHCYENGKFLQPDITVEEMQQKIRMKMIEMGGIFKFFTNYFVKKIPNLKRWKKG